MAENLNISVFDNWPKIDEAAVDALLAREIEASDIKFIVLDDDPTGVQTVHDVDVYTDWSVESIKSGLLGKQKIFYILTNSRGMTVAETTAVHKEIGVNAAKAAAQTGVRYLFMSRSDSTLRGHYPLETVLLREALEADGTKIDGEILCPFFKEGGRYTIGNVHYVRYGEDLVPAADTEFAKDKTFGYTKSAIPEYIEEKTGGEFKAADVTCISLDEIRACDIDGITEKLKAVNGFNKVCVNAIDYCDLKVFSVALYRAIAAGKNFMFRTAAGLVKVAGGISDKPLLTKDEMILGNKDMGGIVVVGSHTAKTTAQLEALLSGVPGLVAIPFDSNKVLDGDDAFWAEVDRVVAAEEEAIKAGKTAVAYTVRKVLTLENDTKESALQRSVKISDGVQSLVGKLSVQPAFIIAKGGITSSDVGTKALRVKKANVLGQICPGIPVWETDDGSKFPHMAYVIFPGNVGDADTLKTAVEKLLG